MLKIPPLTNGSFRSGHKACIAECASSGDKIGTSEATFGYEVGKDTTFTKVRRGHT